MKLKFDGRAAEAQAEEPMGVGPIHGAARPA